MYSGVTPGGQTGLVRRKVDQNQLILGVEVNYHFLVNVEKS